MRLANMFRLIDKLKTFTFFKLTTIYLRYLIGFAFVFASVVKIKGERFTTLPTDTPVGYFFEAMYQTGFYWKFLGWSQLIAGAILMTQRYATVGAMMFFPIILNVTLITHSVNFWHRHAHHHHADVIGHGLLVVVGLPQVDSPVSTGPSNKGRSYANTRRQVYDAPGLDHCRNYFCCAYHPSQLLDLA